MGGDGGKYTFHSDLDKTIVYTLKPMRMDGYA